MTPRPTTPIFLYHQPVDMRKSIDGLSMLVANALHTSPTNGSIFVFCNRTKDKIKLLYWDRNGFCLWYKRLEQGKFLLTQPLENAVQLDPEQLGWLLDGLDYTALKGHQRLSYSIFF